MCFSYRLLPLVLVSVELSLHCYVPSDCIHSQHAVCSITTQNEGLVLTSTVTDTDKAEQGSLSVQSV